jgi:formate dehydrogenase assembly factor FdhD
MVDRAQCSRCGSDEIVPRARVIDRGDDNTRHDLQLEVQRKPNALLFKRAERSNLTARLCGACGHVELLAEMSRALYAAYMQAEGNPAVSALEELERTREALADSQIQLHELEKKLAFLEQLLEHKEPPRALPKAQG